MKKIVPAIALAFVLLLVVIGCKAQDEHQADVPLEETVKVEETQPAETETPEPEESNEPVNQVEQMSIDTTQQDTRQEATQDQLVELFERVYSFREYWAILDESEEGLEKFELEEILYQVTIYPDRIYPSDIQNQYLAWREANYPKEGTVSAPEAGTPSSNPQTQPSTNNQVQPVSNQTGPGGATIVHDPSSDYASTEFKDESLATGGTRFDPDTAIKSTEAGFAPEDPSNYFYGGSN